MTKNDATFDKWFDLLQLNLADAGIKFLDADSVREEYEAGKSMFDVLDSIKQEYAD